MVRANLGLPLVDLIGELENVRSGTLGGWAFLVLLDRRAPFAGKLGWDMCAPEVSGMPKFKSNDAAVPGLLDSAPVSPEKLTAG